MRVSPIAYAADDTTPPVLDVNSIKLDKSVYNAGDTITIRFKATDSESGIKEAYVCFQSENSEEFRAFWFYAYVQPDGTFQGSYEIPKEFVADKFYIDEIILTDNQDNRIGYYSKSPDPSDRTMPCITITINSDYIPPEQPKILSIKLSKTQANVGDTVTFYGDMFR